MSCGLPVMATTPAGSGRKPSSIPAGAVGLAGTGPDLVGVGVGVSITVVGTAVVVACFERVWLGPRSITGIELLHPVITDAMSKITKRTPRLTITLLVSQSGKEIYVKYPVTWDPVQCRSWRRDQAIGHTNKTKPRKQIFPALFLAQW
jgi:hypothetical protein